MGELLLSLLQLQSMDISTFRKTVATDQISAETLQLNFDLDRRKTVMQQNQRRVTTEQIASQLSAISSQAKLDSDPNAYRHPLFQTSLEPMLLEMLVQAKTGSFKVGTTLENCLHLALFVVKKSIRDFVLNNEKRNKYNKVYK